MDYYPRDEKDWRKSTIISFTERFIDGFPIKMARIGLRVYHKGGKLTDEMGQYDGYSKKFDESVSIYSSRIAPINSLTFVDEEGKDPKFA